MSINDAQRKSLLAWVINNDIRTERGEPLDFEEHRFLLDIYADRSPLMCMMKAAQLGLTTYQILKTAHEAYYENRDIIYVMPTQSDIFAFSGGKTNRMIVNNPVLSEWTKDKDSMAQKVFGRGTIYYQGSVTKRGAVSRAAQTLIVDEFDLCDRSIVETYDSRLQAAKNPRKVYFSNPSLPETGIDTIFAMSDKKKWHVTHHCGHEFLFDEECINYKLEIYQCPSCLGEVTTSEVNEGRWIVTDPGKEWSGYWIPLWVNPMFPAKKICEYKREKTPEFFANFVAGTPYVNANDSLTMPMLEKCLTSDENDYYNQRCIIGLDTGHNLHYVMVNKEGIFSHGYVPSVAENPEPGYDPYDRIRALLRNFPKATLVSDQGGDLIGIRRLQQEFPGRVYLCWFVKETKNKQIIRWGENEEMGRVLVDRNRAIQMIVDQIKDAIVRVFGDKQEWSTYFKHWTNIYRVQEMQGSDESSPQYGWRWVWHRKGPDHFALATVYAYVGLDRFAGDVEVVHRDRGGISYQRGIPVSGIITGGQLGVPVNYL